MDALPSGCLYQAGQDAMGLESAFRSCPEANLSKDHHLPERLLRLIVRGRHTGVAKEGKEVFLFRSDQVCPQGLGRFEAKRRFTDFAWFPDEMLFHAGCRIPEDLTGFKLLPCLTGP